MAYLALTAGQVDADSPLDSTLFGQIRDNDIYMKAEKIERDGSIAMTGGLDMDGNNIVDVGDIAPDTITLSAGGGTGIDLSDKDFTTTGDGTVQDFTINGVLTYTLAGTSYVKLSMQGATETAAAGVLKDSTNTLDFLAHLTTFVHFAWVPALLAYGCTFVRTVTDADNLVMSDSMQAADQNARDYGNALPYLLVDKPDDDELLLIHSSSGASVTRTITIDDEIGGIGRSWIFGKLVTRTGAGDDITAAYGGDTITCWPDVPGAPTNAYFMFAVKDGSNDLVVTYNGGAPTNGELNVYVDHVLRPIQSSIP